MNDAQRDGGGQTRLQVCVQHSILVKRESRPHCRHAEKVDWWDGLEQLGADFELHRLTTACETHWTMRIDFVM